MTNRLLSDKVSKLNLITANTSNFFYQISRDRQIGLLIFIRRFYLLELSQKELAEKLAVSPSLVSLWEQGKRSVRAETLISLSEVLRCKPEELLP